MGKIKIRFMLIMGYIGAVIGAGFASGQEILQFFVKYGHSGYYGSIFSMILFALFGALLLYSAHRAGASNYQDMLAYIMGPKAGKGIDILLALFLFMGISTMLSASGAVFYEHLHLPRIAGIITAYLLVTMVLLCGKRGMINSYNILVPLKLLLLIIIMGYAAFALGKDPVEAQGAISCGRNLWMVSSVLYVAYNFSLAMVVLTEYQSISECRASVAGAAWGGLVLGVLIILAYRVLSKFLPDILQYEVPMLYIAGHISKGAKLLYATVLWVGIVTTAIANAYGFTQRFSSFARISYGFCLCLCMTLAIPIAMQDFSILVSRIYPALGVLGLIILAALLWRSTKDIIWEIYYNR